MAAWFMTHVTCRLTAKNRDQLRNPTLGNRVWAAFFRRINRRSMTQVWWTYREKFNCILVCLQLVGFLLRVQCHVLPQSCHIFTAVGLQCISWQTILDLIGQMHKLSYRTLTVRKIQLRITTIHTQPFNGLWSGTIRVGQYQKKHSPTDTHTDHRTSFINLLYLLRSIASSLFSLRAWQSFSTTSLQVLFGLPLGLGPFTSYSMHFFTQSSSSFCRTCPYHYSLFCCNTNAMTSIPNISLSSLLEICLLAWRHTSTWPFSSLLAEVPPHFLSLLRSHFHATYCFAHNYCTTFLS